MPATAVPNTTDPPASGRRDATAVVAAAGDQRGLHADFDAENAVVGALIVNPQTIAVVRAILRPSDFYQLPLQRVVTAIYDFADVGLDVTTITLCDELKSRGELEQVGGKAAIHTLADTVHTSTAVRRHAEIVRDCAAKRRLQATIGRLQETLCANGKSAVELWHEAELTIAQGAAELEAASKTATSAFIDWSGFWDRDHDQAEWLYDDVLARGRGHVIYAARKEGKSLFGLYLAAQLATGYEPIVVVYLDWEMTEADIRDRLLDMGFGPGSDLSRLCYDLLPTLPPLDTPAGGAALAELLDGVRDAWPDYHLVVFMDTLGRAVEGKDNDADTVRAFFLYSGSVLKRRGATWTRFDHSGKDPERGQRGTSAKGDDVDIIWKLTSTQHGIRLDRDRARMPWVPDKVVFSKGEDPLAYQRTTGDWPALTVETAADLDRLGVPLVTTIRAAQITLQHDGVGRRQNIVSAALNWRRQYVGEPR